MVLRTYNADNTRHYKRTPVIGVYVKTGELNFGKSALSKIDFKPGEEIVFHQDDEDPQTWYIEKVATGGLPFRNKKFNGSMFINSRSLVREISESLGIKTNFQMYIASKTVYFEGRTLYQLKYNLYK